MNPQTRRSDGSDVKDLRSEYDFSRGRRGVHHAAYRAGTNEVFLEPDLIEAFPDSESVNQALRLLVRLSRTQAVSRAKLRKTASRSRKRARQNRGTCQWMPTLGCVAQGWPSSLGKLHQPHDHLSPGRQILVEAPPQSRGSMKANR